MNMLSEIAEFFDLLLFCDKVGQRSSDNTLQKLLFGYFVLFLTVFGAFVVRRLRVQNVIVFRNALLQSDQLLNSDPARLNVIDNFLQLEYSALEGAEKRIGRAG